jgi:hypothetical protein
MGYAWMVNAFVMLSSLLMTALASGLTYVPSPPLVLTAPVFYVLTIALVMVSVLMVSASVAQELVWTVLNPSVQVNPCVLIMVFVRA